MPCPDFFVDNIQDKIVVNLKVSTNRRGISWNLLFGSAVLLAWQIRNEKAFHQLEFDVAQMVTQIIGYTNY